MSGEPEAQHIRAQGAINGGTITMSEAFLVSGAGGRWEIDTTGPAEAYWALSGGRYVVDDGETEHDAYFRQVGTRFQVK